MAQVSSGSFNTTSAEGRYLKFNWSVDNTNIASNYKEIYWSLVGAGVGGYVIGGNFKVVIDGETVYSSSTRREIWIDTVIASGYKKIYHTNNGTRSFTASVEAGIYEVAVNCVGRGSWELPTIPRYAKITNFTVSQRDETSVLYNFTADSTCDYAWYSIDNGANWHGLPNTNIVGGLSANTSYNFKLRLRRKDSQLTTDSSTYAQSTYNYPHCTSAPNFTIGNAVKIDFYNPLKRSIEWQVLGVDNSVIAGNTTTGTSYTGISGEESVNNLYKSIPNAKSGTYKVKVTYGSNVATKTGGTYSIKGNEVPTINSFTYYDNDSSIVAITGNNQHIVQNKSTLYVSVGSATANKSSTIKSYAVECNGVTKSSYIAGIFNMGTIDSNTNVDLKLTVTDSRGLIASKTIKVTMLAHNTPSATVTLERLNNYEDETYLTVDGSVSSVNGKNTMTIKYRYKVSGGSYTNYVTIGDKVKQTLSLDKNNAYSFNVVVTDVFGSTFTGEYLLNKGVFPLFIDTVKNSVGINCFPKETNSLEVNALNLFKVANNINVSMKQILLGSNDGLTIKVNDFGGTDKITLIVAGSDNSSMIPVFTVIHMRSGSGFGHINLGLDSTVTRDGDRMHIKASQWSHFTVIAPIGCSITLSNSAL